MSKRNETTATPNDSLSTLIRQMESVSATCEVSIEHLRGTNKVVLWWVDIPNDRYYSFETLTLHANVTCPAFVHALQHAKKVMNGGPANVEEKE